MRTQREKINALVGAGNAVVDRWNSPLWKDVPHTATFIHALRDALSSYQEVQDASSHEPNTIEEILFYWAERGVMLELLAEGGGAWRVYAMNQDGTEHEGDGDHGCHWDVTHIVRVAHWQLRHRGLDRRTEKLFPYPVQVDRPEVRWFERGEAARYANEVMPKFKLDTSDPETQRCLGEMRESMRTGKPVPPRADGSEGADGAS